MTVAVLIPMLTRAHRVAPLLESLRATSPTARPVFICSPDDTAVHNAIDTAGEERITVPGPDPGDYARKINAGYRHTTEELMFLGADDLLFHPGWFEAALAELRPGIGVVGTNDLGNQRTATGKLSTHTMVTRDYADRFGTADGPGLLHEGYWHEFCDNELIDTAKARGQYGHAPDAVVEHLHPLWGKAEPDAMYDAALRRMGQGYALWKKRRPLWTT